MLQLCNKCYTATLLGNLFLYLFFSFSAAYLQPFIKILKNLIFFCSTGYKLYNQLFNDNTLCYFNFFNDVLLSNDFI